MKNLTKNIISVALISLLIGGSGFAAESLVSIYRGGTGASTAQQAINNLTQVSGATNEHVLTKDTATGNAIWKAATGGSMVYPGAGIALSTGSSWGTSITNNSSNWNTAYGWGNHASAGYLKADGTIVGATSQAQTFTNGINGGTAANDDIIIQGTTHATRTTSYVSLQPNGGNVGIGTTVPLRNLEVFSESAATNGLLTGIAISAGTTGTAANGLGSRLEFYIEDNAGNLQESATVGSIFTDVTAGSVDSALVFQTRVNSGGFSEKMRIDALGNVGIGTNAPTAYLNLKAGTTAASTAPLKFTAGTNMTNAEAGAIEWDGTNLFATQTTGPTRKTLAYTDSAITSSMYLGTTAVALNRGSGALTLNGVSIDGSAGSISGLTLTTALTNNGGAGTLAWPAGGATLAIPTGGGTLGTAAFTAATAYLASNGKAVDADLLDNHDTSYFQTALTYPVTGVASPTAGYLTKWGVSGNAIVDGPKLGTLTDTKWCSFSTAGGLACTENAPAGTGDVTDVGDCTGGACFDGTSDGGTYFKFYDAQGATQLIGGDTAGAIVVTMPTTTGTLALTSDTVAKASALATTPTGCGAGAVATAIAANGNLTCGITPIVSANIDTLAELETIMGSINILSETEIDASSELAALMDDETGSGALVFASSPSLVTPAIGAATGSSLHLTGSSTGILTLAQLSNDGGNANTGGAIDFLNSTAGATPLARISATVGASYANNVLRFDVQGAEKMTLNKDGALAVNGTITSSGIFDVTGATGLTLGSADVTGITLTTDGTGNGELSLPADSIGDADIDWGMGAGQVSITAAKTSITAGRSLSWSTDDISADAETYTDTKCYRLSNSTGIANTRDDKSIWYAKNAFTITSLTCESDQTVTAMLQVDDGSPADVDSVDMTCDTTPPEDTSLDGDATLAAGNWLDLDIASVSSTPTWFTICFTGTWDD